MASDSAGEQWLELRPRDGSLEAQLEAHRSELSLKQYMGLELVRWDDAEFPQAFVPLLPPRLQLKYCTGLEGTLQSLAAVSAGQEACEGTEALAEEGPGVRHLRLWDVALTELPHSIGMLTGLRTLDLSVFYKLVALPREVGQLTALHTLDLNGCRKLTALPVEVGQLTALHNLDLSYCEKLAALPAELGQLTGIHGASDMH